MNDSNALLPQLNQKRSFGKQVWIYTIIFLILIFSVYFAFLLYGKTLLRFTTDNIDGLAQSYPFMVGFRSFIENIFSSTGANWSWEIGLGADAVSFHWGKFFNPTYWLLLLLPNAYLDIGWSVMIILYIYLSGITCMLFLRKVEVGTFQTLVGGLCYAFSPWIILGGNNQGTFVWAAVLFPVILLGAEKILKGESPLLFILIVFYSLSSNFKWSYVSGIVVIIFFLVRYVTVYRAPEITNFLKKTGAFIGYGLTGMLLAAPVIFSSLVKWGSASAETGQETPTWFTTKQYYTFPTKLTTMAQAYENYSYLGIAVICVLLIPVVLYGIRKLKTSSILATIFVCMALLPICCSMFNTFSYPTGRWYYTLIFFLVWAAMDSFQEVYLRKKSFRIAMIVSFALYEIYTIGFCGLRRGYLTEIQWDLAVLNCIAGIVLLVLMLVKGKKQTNYLESRGKKAIIMAALVLSIIVNYNVKFNVDNPNDYIGMFADVGESYDLYEGSTQRSAAKIKDDSFYRVDQIEGISLTRLVGSKPNETIYSGTKSIYAFNSSINSLWTEYNKILGNNAGYYKRTSPNGNDNRMGLDLLEGVKYFLGDNERNEPGASAYAGYGFQPYKNIDGVEVLKNKYQIGLGTAYTQYMSKSDFMKLSYPQREEALLQTAVVSDGDMKKIKKTKQVGHTDIESGTKQIPYKIKGEKGVTIDETNKTITANEESVGEEGAEEKPEMITLSLNEVKDCQILVSFENLVYKTKDGEKGFNVSAAVGDVKKNGVNTMESPQGFPDIKDFTLNIGHYDKAPDEVNIRLSEPGTYTYDDIKVYAMPTKIYDKYAPQLQENRYKIDTLENDYVKGTFNCSKDSLLYFSILATDGWDIYIDGKKAEKIIPLNLAFIGAEVSKGAHVVELRYHTPGLTSGMILSAIGLIVLAAIMLYRRKLQGTLEVKEKEQS